MPHRALTDALYDRQRAFAVGFLICAFLIYAVYAHEYAAAFNADCLQRHHSLPMHVDNGTPNVVDLAAFILGMLPLLFVRRSALGYLIALLFVYIAWSLTTLIDPYNQAEQQFDCPANGGNNEDLIGEYAGFGLGYILMVGAFYVVAATDLISLLLTMAYRKVKGLSFSASGIRD